MAIAYVNDTSTGAEAGSTTLVLPALNVTTGNAIVGGIKYEGVGTTCSVSDTAGNSYTVQTRVDHSNGDIHIHTFYAVNVTGNASNVITITLGASRSFRRGGAAQFSGVATSSPLDQVANGQANSGTSMSTSNFASSVPSGALIFAIAGEYAPQTYTPGTNFTELWDIGQDGGGSIPGSQAAEYRVVPSSGTYNATMTQGSSAEWLLAAITLKEAGASGIDLSGALASQAATASGAFGPIVGISGTPAAQAATMSSALSAIVGLSGSLAAPSSSISSALSIIGSFSGALASAAAAMSGSVSVGGDISLSGSLAAGSSSISSALSIIASLSGVLASSSATASGAVSPISGFSGNLTQSGAVVLSGALSAIVGISGTPQAQSATMSGALASVVGLSGSLASTVATISGALSPIYALAGALASGSASISGLFGDPDAAIFSGALLSQKAILDGDLRPHGEFSGILWSQPAIVALGWTVVFPQQGTGFYRRARRIQLAMPRRRH